MPTPYTVPADKLINEVAQDLKNNIKLKQPGWVQFVKTGSHKEKTPDDENWWFIRGASILRKVYLNSGEKELGVERLRTAYGGRKNRGVKPEKRTKAGGKIIRTLLQELDNAGFTEKTKKGRRITKRGLEYLNKISENINSSVSKNRTTT